MNPKEAIHYIHEHECELVDIRFTDLFGMWHHFTIPATDFTESVFEEGLGFDGSSIRGFQSIDQSDMLLVPDPDSLFVDPFAAEYPTAVVICDIEDPLTRERYSRDPRNVAKKAENYLKTTGIADTAFMGPEAEFFLFDSLQYSTNPWDSGFRIDSTEGHWNSGTSTVGNTIRPKGGYFPCAPVDKLQDVRSEMMMRMRDIGIHVEVHHHEVATAGQCEIDMRFDTLLVMADRLQKYKYVVKNVAAEYGLIATFMPKPLFGDNGSGMHVHQSLWKNGKTLMYDEKGYAGLSDEARWYIGGILKHAPALLAFCAPTTNSYRRLVPGYEAPINLIYSSRNRSACVRIPMYSPSPKAKRIEFRAPDPMANPYLAFSAMLMAGLDGIMNRIEPMKPVDKDLYELPAEEKKDIPQTPGSLRDVLHALAEDHEFLLRGDVFTKDLIETYIDYKLKNECDAIDLRPHPYEFYMYADA